MNSRQKSRYLNFPLVVSLWIRCFSSSKSFCSQTTSGRLEKKTSAFVSSFPLSHELKEYLLTTYYAPWGEA